MNTELNTIAKRLMECAEELNSKLPTPDCQEMRSWAVDVVAIMQEQMALMDRAVAIATEPDPDSGGEN